MNTNAPLTAAQIETFRAAVEARVRELHTKVYKGATDCVPSIETETGPKFVRLVINNGYGSRSAYGFVEKATGAVLKADGWKRPARNFTRGNIADQNGGLGRCDRYSVV